jgi:DEAD/DEAH box helicase domain-containing protein
LRFLVVDELHTFDGAQGADLALLIRRLKHRLGTPEGHLTCVGSSATLASDDAAATELRAYARTIFGERFDETSVIRETRQAARDVFGDPEYTDWPAPAELAVTLETATGMSQAEAARHLARRLFAVPSDPDLLMLHEGDPSAFAWRCLLGRLLRQQLAVQRVVRVIAEHAGPAPLSAIAESLGTAKAVASWSLGERMRLAQLVVSLISWAREGAEDMPQPLFGVRIQFWVREMVRMVSNLPKWTDDGSRTSIDLQHAHDLDERELKRVLPIVNCNRCGTTAHLGRQPPRGLSLWAPLFDLYEAFFDSGSSRLRLIYHESVSRKAGTSGRGEVITGFMDADGLAFAPGDHADRADRGSQSPVWLYDPTDAQGEVDRTCPACGHAHGLLLFGLRAARVTAALTNTLYASEQNEEDPKTKPRFLMFSNSVQDAAQRAAVAEIRNTGAVIRKSLFRAITETPTRGLRLDEVINDVPKALRSELGDEAFVATFIARNQTWRKQYENLLQTNVLPADDRFLNHVTFGSAGSIFLI